MLLHPADKARAVRMGNPHHDGFSGRAATGWLARAAIASILMKGGLPIARS